MTRRNANLSPVPDELSATIETNASASTHRSYYLAPNAIPGFFGRHRWLSNFYKVEILADNVLYPSVEHAFQAAKTLDPFQRQRICAQPDAAAAKRIGRQVSLRRDWNAISLTVMLELLRCKFDHPQLAAALLDTGDRYLAELNSWNDRIWGVVSTGNGVTVTGGNRLGLCLMQIRRELRHAPSS